MGKVKWNKLQKELKEGHKYQSPMGKVKRRRVVRDHWNRFHVSIPYGKGKVERKEINIGKKILYQSPMGKVKTDMIRDTRELMRYQSPMGKVKTEGCDVPRYG